MSAMIPRPQRSNEYNQTQVLGKGIPGSHLDEWSWSGGKCLEKLLGTYKLPRELGLDDDWLYKCRYIDLILECPPPSSSLEHNGQPMLDSKEAMKRLKCSEYALYSWRTKCIWLTGEPLRPEWVITYDRRYAGGLGQKRYWPKNKIDAIQKAMDGYCPTTDPDMISINKACKLFKLNHRQILRLITKGCACLDGRTVRHDDSENKRTPSGGIAKNIQVSRTDLTLVAQAKERAKCRKPGPNDDLTITEIARTLKKNRGVVAKWVKKCVYLPESRGMRPSQTVHQREGRPAETFVRSDVELIRENLRIRWNGVWTDPKDGKLYRSPENAEKHYAPYLKAGNIRHYLRKKTCPFMPKRAPITTTTHRPTERGRRPADTVTLCWDDHLQMVHDAMKMRAGDKAALRDLLKNGPVLGSDVKHAMFDRGMTKDMLAALCVKLGVLYKRQGQDNLYYLPGKDHPLPGTRQDPNEPIRSIMVGSTVEARQEFADDTVSKLTEVARQGSGRHTGTVGTGHIEGPQDSRNAWMYERRLQGQTYKEIQVQLKKTASEKGWEELDSEQAVRKAIQSWCRRHNKQFPTRQQPEEVLN